MLPRRATFAARRCWPQLGVSRSALFRSSSSASSKDPLPSTVKAEASTATKRASPVQNLRNALDALDVMIDEAEKKVEKKYRPNMFAEFKQLNDKEGKVVEGPETLVAVAKAALVPSLAVEDLEGKHVDLQALVSSGKVTLVLTSFKAFGQNMLPAWRDGFMAAFTDRQGQEDDRVQTATLNVVEDWYMKLVRGSITRGLQEQTPKTLHARTFSYFGRCDAFRTPLELNNSFVGYAHLVDGKGRIRWLAGGPATPLELERLVKVTKELLAQSEQPKRR
ncbi:hypothetical protein BBJ28_00016486 [Nothophytophthora sp. Chile5]|nr:hypothetical protein BBJ28_00016486 [Nothophytophthora sp. Chile5]